MEVDGECSSTADQVNSCGTQNMSDEKIPAKPIRIKRCPRPYLKKEVLYDGDKWIDWALTPYILEDLIEMRNNKEKRFYIHVAGICQEDGVSGFGYIIRDCHGTPISAYSESVPNVETEPLSRPHRKRKAYFLEMKAVDKSLELADKLGLKYILMVCKKCDIATAVLDCYYGEIYSVHDEDVVSVSVEIMRKLLERRSSYPEEYNIFNIHAGPSIGVNQAVYVAGLAASEGKSKLEISFNEGRENMPLVKDKLAELMGLLHTEASTYSCFHP